MSKANVEAIQVLMGKFSHRAFIARKKNDSTLQILSDIEESVSKQHILLSSTGEQIHRLLQVYLLSWLTRFHIYSYVFLPLNPCNSFIFLCYRRTSLYLVLQTWRAVSGRPTQTMWTTLFWQASAAQYAAPCSIYWTIQMQHSTSHHCLRSSCYSLVTRWHLTLHWILAAAVTSMILCIRWYTTSPTWPPSFQELQSISSWITIRCNTC